MPAAVEIHDLHKRYGPREVVRGLSLTAEEGRLTAVLGPNGAGKTTTIECCEGLRRPDGGTVRVLGTDPLDRSARPALSEQVGVMLQDGGLPQAPRAGAVLSHFARLYRDPWPPGELVERLGLTDVLRTPVRRLSGGQRQRLALAAALVGRPRLVFLDEPSAGMDPHARLAVWDLVRELRAAGTTFVLTTHLMEEAAELADDVVVVDGGRVVAAGTPDELCGGARVRVAGRADLAGAVAERLAAGGRPDLTVQVAAGHLEVSAPAGADAGTVVAVATALSDLGHAGASVELVRRTLEDVFLEVTGHPLQAVAA